MFGPTYDSGERREMLLQNMFGTVNCIINKFILTTHRSKQSRRLGSVGILFWDANFKIKKANTVLIFFT